MDTYGCEGGGYALGFDSAVLGSYDKAVVGSLDFFRVDYERATQIDSVAEFCSRAFHHLERFVEKCDDDERGPALDCTGKTLAFMAQWYSARVKDAAFREEREWRFIWRNPTSPNSPAAYQRQFRATKRGLAPCVALELGQLGGGATPAGEFPLKRVRVGPTAGIELAGRAMNYLLKDSGFDMQAEPSSIPLRP